MEFKFFIGTKVLFGENCIEKHKQELAELGKKAFIVTGGSSAKASGALSDIESVFEELGIAYCIFDRVENNPSIPTVEEGGKLAREFGADMVVGIGGGSPLDASKAIAVLAANDISPLKLYMNKYEKKPLPIIAIPTTAGTGSEVTPYSILTREDMETKMSFGNDDTFPRLAIMDARYTESMPYQVTVNTAVDALSHAVEGYLSKRSTPISDILALEAVGLFGKCTDRLITGNIDFDVREKLLYAAMLGGMVISHTGTTLVHGMGYNLTYFKGIPHGRANGLLMEEYFNFNYSTAGEKIDRLLRLMGTGNIAEFGTMMKKMLGPCQELGADEIEKYAEITMKQRSTGFNIRNTTKEDIEEIYRKVLFSD